MTWDQQMLARLASPDNWSRARWRAEEEWTQIWCGRTGIAVVGSRVVEVERKRPKGVRPWRDAA